MQTRYRLTAILILILLIVSACNRADLQQLDAIIEQPTLTPTLVPTITPPQVRLTPSLDTVRVGETIRVQVELFQLGCPLYRITLENLDPVNLTPITSSAPVFQIINLTGTPQPCIILPEIELQAVNTGTVRLGVSVSGEGGSYNTGYYWTAADASIILTVLP